MSHQQLEKRLETLPKPLSKICGRFKNSKFDFHPDVLRIQPQPWEGAESYVFWVFSPSDTKDFKSFESIHGIRIHEKYRDLLLVCNGFQAFGFELYGIPAGTLKDPPQMNRSGYECLDLAQANQHWKSSFDIDQTLFHFGGRNYTDEENCGYFLNDQGAIYSYREDGRKIKQWRSFDRFLQSEIAAAEDFARSEFPDEWQQVDQQLM